MAYWSMPRYAPLLISKCLDAVMVFSNSHLIMNHLNKLAVIAAHTNASHFLFPKRTSQTESSDVTSDALHDGKYEMFDQMNNQIKSEIKELVLSCVDYEMENDSVIAGAVAMALCYIHRMEKECPVGVNLTSRILTYTMVTWIFVLPGIVLVRLAIRRDDYFGGWHNVIKGSDDNPAQYMNFMNTVFTAQKQNIVIDACLLENDSGLLQQACDITGGMYLKVPQPAGLLQYLLWVFLPDPQTRDKLTLPPRAQVDYRAACFCHRNLIDIGYVCSVCLSIFCTFSPICSTCQTTFKIMPTAKMMKKKKKGAAST